MTYFVYKLTYDCGTAPHIRNGLLSLAICKPRIRESAVEGDVLFGFSGRSRKVNRGERLLYVAEVTRKLDTAGEYYERAEFRNRWDCIYERRKGGRLVWRPGSLTHQDDEFRAKDLGPAPRYPRALVLLSKDFRYLGADGTMDYARQWPNLATYVHELGVGHRKVAPESETGRMLTELKRKLWRVRSAQEVGAPTQPFAEEPAWDREARNVEPAPPSAPQSRGEAAHRARGKCG